MLKVGDRFRPQYRHLFCWCDFANPYSVSGRALERDTLEAAIAFLDWYGHKAPERVVYRGDRHGH